MTPQLEEAIREVYDAFKDVAKPTRIDHCTHCHTDEEYQALLTKPLRQLSPDELSRYSSSAMKTAGEEQDFCYFLPRILEISVTHRSWWPAREVIAGAIQEAGYASWSQLRQKAVLRVFATAFTDLLTSECSGDGGSDFGSWLCTLAILGADLAPFLAKIAASDGHLICFYEDNAQPLIKGRITKGFWDEAPRQRELIVAWFRSPEIQLRIKAYYGMS